MGTTGTRLLTIVAGFTAGYLLMSATPLAAQDDCKAMAKAVAAAFVKVHNTPTHVYNTTKISGQTFPSEMIYAAGSVYLKINGKWTLSDSIKDLEQPAPVKAQNANSKDTCRYVKDEPVNGEMAALYSSHSETSKGKIDLQFWISKATGLPLRQETDSDGGKALISTRYEYGNVKPPL
jgi:hypothetical protein